MNVIQIPIDSQERALGYLSYVCNNDVTSYLSLASAIFLDTFTVMISPSGGVVQLLHLSLVYDVADMRFSSMITSSCDCKYNRTKET